MYLENLDIDGVRNLSDLHLECHPILNVIAGRNAAGKTAILEGVFVLSRVHSFRTPRISDVIQHGKESLSVTARIIDKDGKKVVTGIVKSKQGTQIKFNGNKILKRSEQVRNVPVITVTTESHRLLYGSPKERRHWLDWSLFHVEPKYMQFWYEYHHALRQRNALLRGSRESRQFEAWETIMAKNAVKLRKNRSSYLDQISRILKSLVDENIKEYSLTLQSAEENESMFCQKLAEQRKNDMVVGHTQYGPHREDVLFKINDYEAGKIMSRGEGKQFVVFLLVSQAFEYSSRMGQTPILLVDDLPSELDVDAREKMLNTLVKQKQQLFITTTSPELLEINKVPHAMFHVEHGKLVKVVE